MCLPSFVITWYDDRGPDAELQVERLEQVPEDYADGFVLGLKKSGKFSVQKAIVQ